MKSEIKQKTKALDDLRGIISITSDERTKNLLEAAYDAIESDLELLLEM